MVQKFKIVSKTVELTIIETDKDGSRDAAAITKRALVHPDLQRSLDKLRVHWGLMMDYINPKQVKDINNPDEKLLEAITIYGYAYSGGDDDNATISILGRRTVMGGHCPSVASKNWMIEGNPETRYIFMDELVGIMEEVQERVDAYIDGTERGKDTDTGEPATKPKKEKVTHARIAEPLKADGNTSTTAIGAQLATADPDAQKRVAGASFEGTAAEYQAQIDKGAKPKPPKGGRKPPQSQDNPAGQ